MVPGAVSSVVQGIVYLDIDATALACIDAFEAGHYVREQVVVVDDAQRRLDCWAYVVRSDFAHILTEQTWTADWFAKHGLAKFLDRYAGFNDHPRDV